MSFVRLILLSVRHFWKMNVAVACGVAVGTAVLTGALLVGDSMQGSLRDLVLAGLGRIDDVLVADHFFREQLADEKSSGSHAAPAILYSASLETVDPAPPARMDQVNLIGCDQRFWELGNGNPPAPLKRDEIILNEPVARSLGRERGRLGDARPAQDRRHPGGKRLRPQAGLGRYHAAEDRPRGPGRGLGPLRPAAQSAGAAERLRFPRHFAGSTSRARPGQCDLPPQPPPDLPWHPQLADYGIHVEPSPLGYVQLTTDQMIFPPAIEQALLKQLSGMDVQPTLTYLANSITCGNLEVPYSTITAIDFQDKPPLGPFVAADGSPVPTLGDDQIALNAWAADRLKAKVGDTIRVTYFEPESTFGLLQEHTADLRLAAIVKLEGAAADKALTPTVSRPDRQEHD